MHTSSMPSPGDKLMDYGKQYSQASVQALGNLSTITEKFDGINERVEELASVLPENICQSDFPVLLKAKHEL